ncbi:hypothetical protein DIE07_24965 [Burkholderia sp. Bp9002]|nr:hypothetical protein DIE07_24965 [Burkholderia sp. Bp9002]
MDISEQIFRHRMLDFHWIPATNARHQLFGQIFSFQITLDHRSMPCARSALNKLHCCLDGSGFLGCQRAC